MYGKHLIPTDRRPAMLWGTLKFYNMASAATDPPSRCTCQFLEPHRRRHSTTGLKKSNRRADDAISRPCHHLRRGRAADGQRILHAGVAHLLLEADARRRGRAARCRRRTGVVSMIGPILLAAGLTHTHLVVLTFAHMPASVAHRPGSYRSTVSMTRDYHAEVRPQPMHFAPCQRACIIILPQLLGWRNR